MVPFSGWDMPLHYSGTVAEIRAVRSGSGIFDVSHMGRLYISGSNSTEFLDWVLTGSAARLRVGRARYCMICNEAGGVIDDTVFYRLADNRYLLIPNGANRDEIVAWFQRWIDEKFAGGCTVNDRTSDTGLIAFQGPETARILDQLASIKGGILPSMMRPFSCQEIEILKRPVFVGRTGYTGEDGFELLVAAADANDIWCSLMDLGAVPCGLGARDVLRLEAALPLHGHEIDQHTTPLEAGLDRFVRFEKEFVGRDALLRQQANGLDHRLVGLALPGRRAPRSGYHILFQDEKIGCITSGTYSPTLDMSIAMGYVLERYTSTGQELDIDIRGSITKANVVSLPFYIRAGGHKRIES
jgi:aminomethyltransferase